MAEHLEVKEIEQVVIRFSGDSGDGMQLAGNIFSTISATVGNGISTFPDYPADIRAPQGSLTGVSGYQVHIGEDDVLTPGDKCDVLVAMNAAALKTQYKYAKPQATIIIDTDNFTAADLRKACFVEDDFIGELGINTDRVVACPMTQMVKETLKDSGLEMKTILKTRNMFALGIVCWLFNRDRHLVADFLHKKFERKPAIAENNIKVVEAGYNYAANTHASVPATYRIESRHKHPGRYMDITGNKAAAYGLIAAAERSKLKLYLGSYPITPATDILIELSKHKSLGIITVQSEDEIGACSSAIGAAFAGALAVTSTSGPGISLKSEAMNLAVMDELPLVVVDVQRGGPSTGMPTKGEQTDLLQVLVGRNGESPMPVIAPVSPSDCFTAAYQACKMAVEHLTPVVLLSDAYIANGSAAWRLPDVDKLPNIQPHYATSDMSGTYKPFHRDPESLSRYWAIPGHKGFTHIIGGLEKDGISGEISNNPDNHDRMVRLRAAKVARIQVPDIKVLGDVDDADLLIVGFGGTFGHLYQALDELQNRGHKVALAHFKYINPLPKNAAEVLRRYPRVVVAEQNLGQFAAYLRMRVDGFVPYQYNKIEGQPFKVAALVESFEKILASPAIQQGGAASTNVPVVPPLREGEGVESASGSKSIIEIDDNDEPQTFTPQDFKHGQPRWCPGCGDHMFLMALHKAMAKIGVAPWHTAVISGIGCSSRLPYYMNTYAMQTIHGRAAAVALGAKVINPKLTVWQVSGDGDGLAIGGNHFIHAVRRNIDINMILLNNRIYGLTKGEYSPTSPRGFVSKTSPYGTVEDPFRPAELCFGARGRFFARAVANDVPATEEILCAANNHKGTSVCEILQNCVIFNNGAYDPIYTHDGRKKNAIYVRHGQPLVFGENNEYGLIQMGFGLRVVKIGENGFTINDILIHDAHAEDDTLQLALAMMDTRDGFPVALGVIRDVDSPTYDACVNTQIEEVKAKKKYHTFNELLETNDIWEVK